MVNIIDQCHAAPRTYRLYTGNKAVNRPSRNMMELWIATQKLGSSVEPCPASLWCHDGMSVSAATSVAMGTMALR